MQFFYFNSKTKTELVQRRRLDTRYRTSDPLRDFGVSDQN